ncbi:MAG: hypothetical protein A2W77_00790 [Nitrospinae bacterium RIFCSPLOWO2_12_39_16]|nr:MAG: hypothetical protein A2W77_00790 [Nitrospinae bacterium RIFCSPLOWO2_12_39_16]
MKLIILSPVYNDWESAKELLSLINDELSRAALTAEILFVDDGSDQPQPSSFNMVKLSAIHSVQTLQLKNNVGHQRAIAIGMSYIYEKKACDAVVVMDSDGEDKPNDIVRLVRALEAEIRPCIIFAERVSRSEGMKFSLFYHLYRWLYAKFTGHKIRFGNFSILSFSILGRIVVDPNLWNHFAASVSRSKHLLKTIPSNRGSRLFGKSKLNFTALVLHGLSAMSCYNEIIAARLLFSTLMSISFFLAGIVAIVAIKLFSTMAIAGWATYTIGILTIISLQILLISLTFMFTLLGNRKNQPFIPLRDYAYFIDRLKDENDR